tara:strand:+ start:7912 stop:8085 length:174 start_codon:yes stop_codon:yes gene_type:complete
MMKREAIDARIRVVNNMLAEARKVEDIKFCNRMLERLIMMQSDEEIEEEARQSQKEN